MTGKLLKYSLAGGKKITGETFTFFYVMESWIMKLKRLETRLKHESY